MGKLSFQRTQYYPQDSDLSRLRGTEQTANVGLILGVVSAISIDNGKFLDVAILSKSCQGFTSMKEITYSDPARCETWKLSHNCNLNCTDCSPGMETTGTFKIFSSSKEKHGLY